MTVPGGLVYVYEAFLMPLSLSLSLTFPMRPLGEAFIPTPSFSGEVEQKEMMSVTEQLLPQIGEKYKNLDIKEKKAYKEALINYLEDVQTTGATGVGEAFCEDVCGILGVEVMPF